MFDSDRDLPPIPDFTAAVWAAVRSLPSGAATTYGRIAEALGDRVAAKAVAVVLQRPHDATDCGCFRVVRAGGALGRYAHGSPDEQMRRLIEDGVPTENTCVSHLTEVRRSDILSPLREWQSRTGEQPWSGPTVTEMPRFIGGVDVSYTKAGQPVAAAVVYDRRTGETIAEATASGEAALPYISGYLTFRELPSMAAAWAAVAKESRQRPSIVLVDGSGRLHPRGNGIACSFAAVTGCATIGITKAHLHGDVATSDGGRSPILVDGRVKGFQLTSPGVSARLDVSPGQGIDPTLAAAVVSHSMRGHRLPEPIFVADRLSRAVAQTL